jgi:hypothetical protein
MAATRIASVAVVMLLASGVGSRSGNLRVQRDVLAHVGSHVRKLRRDVQRSLFRHL